MTILTELEEFERAERVRAAMKEAIKSLRMGTKECKYSLDGKCSYCGTPYGDVPIGCTFKYGKACWVGRKSE